MRIFAVMLGINWNEIHADRLKYPVGGLIPLYYKLLYRTAKIKPG